MRACSHTSRTEEQRPVADPNWDRVPRSRTMRSWRPARLSAVVIVAFVVARCSSSSPSNPTPTPTPTPTGPAVTTIVTGVQATDGTTGVQQAGSPPAASGGPTVTAATSTTVVPGGSDIVTLTST